MSGRNKRIIVCVLVMMMLQAGFAQDVKLEPIEWSDIWIMNADKEDQPRVLLVGDSIVKGYYDEVEKGLSGRAACARYATSKFLGNPDYLAELGLLLKRYTFDVIHINNGLHGWEHSEEEYRQGLNRLLALIKQDAPEAKLIWGMTTPVRLAADLSRFDVSQNDRVIERNRIAAEVINAAGIPVNDLYELVKDHPRYFSGDGVHFNEKGQQAQAKSVVEQVGKILED